MVLLDKPSYYMVRNRCQEEPRTSTPGSVGAYSESELFEAFVEGSYFGSRTSEESLDNRNGLLKGGVPLTYSLRPNASSRPDRSPLMRVRVAQLAEIPSFANNIRYGFGAVAGSYASMPALSSIPSSSRLTHS